MSNETPIEIPQLIPGGLFVDDRGTMQFINEFPQDFNLKRIYTVENFNTDYVRSWHGHLNESKIIFVISGTAKVVVFPITENYLKKVNIDSPDYIRSSSEYLIERRKLDNYLEADITMNSKSFVLSSKSPKLLRIPKGYANGLVSLEPNTKIQVFSDITLEDAKTDDYRIDAKFGRSLFNTTER